MRSERHKEFLPLLVTHKDMLYQYILIMVPFQTIAEDILQDTIIILWEKFDDFTVGTSLHRFKGNCRNENNIHVTQNYDHLYSSLRITCIRCRG